MDKIFHLDSLEAFQKAIKEVLEYYCAKNVSQGFKNSQVLGGAKDELMNLLLNSNFDTQQVSNLLGNKGWEEERIIYFKNLLDEKRTEILYATLIRQNCGYGETITGFDWLLKMVLGTSELNTLKYPLLQLVILSTDSNDFQKKVVYDLNKDILLKTIDALENLDDL